MQYNCVLLYVSLLLHLFLQGNGYWEYLLCRNGVDVIAFDNNSIYPESMHYISIQVINNYVCIAYWYIELKCCLQKPIECSTPCGKASLQ